MRVISQDDFNPRSREGSDEVTDKWMILKNYFNPRSREGSDTNPSQTSKCLNTFQSALPRRERQYQKKTFLAMNPISIRAPAKGATTITV